MCIRDRGAAMARSAGTFAQLAAREGNFAILRLPSGDTRMVLVTCLATVGTVFNADHNLESFGKAGRNRWFGRRPHNRGVVMNPVDHPMGCLLYTSPGRIRWSSLSRPVTSWMRKSPGG